MLPFHRMETKKNGMIASNYFVEVQGVANADGAVAVRFVLSRVGTRVCTG